MKKTRKDVHLVGKEKERKRDAKEKGLSSPNLMGSAGIVANFLELRRGKSSNVVWVCDRGNIATKSTRKTADWTREPSQEGGK